MESQNQYILSKKNIFLISFLYPGIIILICLFCGKNFFNTYDAINEFIGYYSEYGRIFAEGKLPFIVDRIMFGGNGVVELSHSFLNPQAIIASLIAWFCEKKQIIGIFIAYSNLFITCLAALALSRLFRFSKLSSLLFAGFVLVQPLVIVEYCRSWWNSGIGHVWGLASVTTLLYYYNNRSIRNFLLNVIAILCLMIDCWVYSVVCYLLLMLLIAIYIILKNRGHGRLNLLNQAFLIFPFVVSCFIISPLYLEYIYSSDIHNRFVGLFNNNFLAFPVSDFILSYIPTFYEFMTYFNSKMAFMAIGFSTIFIPMALFFRKNILLFSEDGVFRLFIFYILGLFLLTQLPEVVGSTKWSLRYAPFLTFFLTFITFYSLQYAERAPHQKSNIYGCILFLASGFYITISRIAGKGISLFVIDVISFILIVSILLFKENRSKYRDYYYILTPLLCLVLILIGIQKTGFLRSLPYLHNPAQLELPSDLNTQGFIFRGGQSVHKGPSYPYLSEARGGIYNLRTITGYTPLGYKALNSFIPKSHPRRFDSQASLDKLLDNIEGTNICRAIEWRISSFVIEETVAKQNRERLEKCGYREGGKQPIAGYTYFSLPPTETAGWDSLPPISIPALPSLRTVEHSNNYDRIWVPERSESVRLVFPRQYWHGYRAYLNNEQLTVQPDDVKMLTEVVVPAGSAGVLELEYFPVTWRRFWCFPLMGLLGILAGILLLKKYRYIISAQVALLPISGPRHG